MQWSRKKKKKINNKQSLCSTQVQASLNTQKKCVKFCRQEFSRPALGIAFCRARQWESAHTDLLQISPGSGRDRKVPYLEEKKKMLLMGTSIDQHVIFWAAKSTFTLCPSVQTRDNSSYTEEFKLLQGGKSSRHLHHSGPLRASRAGFQEGLVISQTW